jgi:hypothetical protein
MVGRFRNCRNLNWGLSSPLLRGMSWKQRVSAFCHCVTPPLSTMNRVICSWLVPLLIASGNPLIAAHSSADLQKIVDAYLLAKVASRVEEMLTSTSCGYFALRRRIEGSFWLSTHLFFSMVKDTLPKSLGGIRIGFIPTALAESKIQERHPDRRPPLFHRLRVMILYQRLWYHVATLTIIFTILFSRVIAGPTGESRLQYLMIYVLVPGAEWSNYFALFRPLVYAVWPPVTKERRELMERNHPRPRTSKSNGDFTLKHDQDFEIWRPKDEQKTERWDKWALLPEVPRTISLLFWCLVCIESRRH